MTPKATETIGKDFRLTADQARELVEEGKKRGWLSVRTDAAAMPVSIRTAQRRRLPETVLP